MRFLTAKGCLLLRATSDIFWNKNVNFSLLWPSLTSAYTFFVFASSLCSACGFSYQFYQFQISLFISLQTWRPSDAVQWNLYWAGLFCKRRSSIARKSHKKYKLTEQSFFPVYWLNPFSLNVYSLNGQIDLYRIVNNICYQSLICKIYIVIYSINLI